MLPLFDSWRKITAAEDEGFEAGDGRFWTPFIDTIPNSSNRQVCELRTIKHKSELERSREADRYLYPNIDGTRPLPQTPCGCHLQKNRTIF
jgi:hypothetical protein